MANRPTRVVVLVLVALALTLAFTGTALAHNQNSASVDCATVSGSFTQFAATDHPIVWHVAVNGGSYQTVATSESPPGFVGAGTATANIGSLTTAIGPGGGTVQVYAEWPGGQSVVTAVHLATCDTPPPTVPPPTVPPTTPKPPPTSGPPVVVVVSPAPVAFAPVPLATPPVPVVVTPSTTG